MEQQTEVQQKTRTHISQVVGISIITAFGALGAAAFMLFGTTKPLTTKQIVNITSPSTTTAKDLTNAALPTKEMLAASGFSTVATTSTTALDPSVAVVITSPTEGATVNGDATVTVSLNDPNHKAAGVRLLLYGSVLPDSLQGVASSVKTTAPYTFPFNLGMYPSGEYRYVAQAVIFDPTISGADTSVVIATADTMVTWVRTCYYLAYQDMTLDAPTSTVTAGLTFNLTGSVTNKQRGNCQHIYSLRTQDPLTLDNLLPNGWLGTIDQPQMNLGINETKPFALTVRVPSGTAAGTYKVGANSNLLYTGFSVTKKVDVTVVAGDGGPIKVLDQ